MEESKKKELLQRQEDENENEEDEDDEEEEEEEEEEIEGQVEGQVEWNINMENLLRKFTVGAAAGFVCASLGKKICAWMLCGIIALQLLANKNIVDGYDWRKVASTIGKKTKKKKVKIVLRKAIDVVKNHQPETLGVGAGVLLAILNNAPHQLPV